MSSLIDLDSVSYSYSGSSLILDNVSLSVAEGEIVTVIGPNGGGKSTLAKVILGLIKPSIGKITKSKKLTFTYMPQKLIHNHYMPITVCDFLQLSLQSKKLNKNVLENQKVLTLMEKQLNELSGGEIQRVLFAKSILSNADVFVLDEPTQCLDINGQEEFYSTLNYLNKSKNKTIILISHDLHIVMKSSSKVVCINKHLCCSGSPEDVYANKNYTEIFGKNLSHLSYYQHHHNHEH